MKVRAGEVLFLHSSQALCNVMCLTVLFFVCLMSVFLLYVREVLLLISPNLFEFVLVVLLQVLADFPHTTTELKIDYLLDLFPEIQPRSFSIASSLEVTHYYYNDNC